MLNSIVNFFTATFRAIGRGIGLAVAFVLRPFIWLGRWFTERGILLKVLLGLVLIGFVALYGYFFWNTQVWSGFDTNYAKGYERAANVGAGGAKPKHQQQSGTWSGTRQAMAVSRRSREFIFLPHSPVRNRP